MPCPARFSSAGLALPLAGPGQDSLDGSVEAALVLERLSLLGILGFGRGVRKAGREAIWVVEQCLV